MTFILLLGFFIMAGAAIFTASESRGGIEDEDFRGGITTFCCLAAIGLLIGCMCSSSKNRDHQHELDKIRLQYELSIKGTVEK